MTSVSTKVEQFKEIYLNGTWVVGTNLKEVLLTTTWQEAVATIGDHNTIASLAYHLNYYLEGVHQVLKGGDLTIRDKYSFDLKPIDNEADWDNLRDRVITNAEAFCKTLAGLPIEILGQVFVKEQYGDYERNLSVIVEHGYYHLGQIVLLKKLIRQKTSLRSQ